uniref:Carbonic anhydrase n=1 Tax=Heterorhabditis bacteriophora TaxID=37862 RepID=A0A1I7X7B7_HETBA
MPGLNKILNGVIRFRQTVRNDLVTSAALKIILNNIYSRFTQSQVGDMFVVRNSGNMIPHANNYGSAGFEVSVTTEPAALELAVKRGKINHVIVCGHSDCKAINTLYNLHCCPKTFDAQSPMDHWLRRHGYTSLKKLEELLAHNSSTIKFVSENPLFSFEARIDPDNIWSVEDKLSQINTLQQLENITSHGFLKVRFSLISIFLYLWCCSYFHHFSRSFWSMNWLARFISNRYATSASALTKKRKFYKDVSIVNSMCEGKQLFNIALDNRILKTQGGHILKVKHGN